MKITVNTTQNEYIDELGMKFIAENAKSSENYAAIESTHVALVIFEVDNQPFIPIPVKFRSIVFGCRHKSKFHMVYSTSLS